MSTSTISYPTYAGAISILESIMLDEKYNPFTRAKIARGVIPKYGLHQHEFACAAAQLTFAKIAQTNETEVNELTLKIEEKLNKLAQHRRNDDQEIFNDLQQIFYAIVYIVQHLTGFKRENYCIFLDCLNEVFRGKYGWQI